jgi:riboflavin synthase
MFTGLIQHVGEVLEVAATGAGSVLRVMPPGTGVPGWECPVTLGESISVSGCCLTVVEASESLAFDVVPETLSQTTLGGLQPSDRVNLERSLRADSLLGGHLVQGHVDGVEEVLSVSPEGASDRRVRISAASIDGDAVVSKGSITVDGVSLTVAATGDGWFEVALVPTTLAETTLGHVSPGDAVNIETDILARTVAHVLRRMGK